MKKLTKSSLEELAQVMPVLSEQEQSLYVGGDTFFLDREGRLLKTVADENVNAIHIASDDPMHDSGQMMYLDHNIKIESKETKNSKGESIQELSMEGIGTNQDVFKFLADNTTVEWGYSCNMGASGGFINTNHSRDSLSFKKREGYDTFMHNHPEGTPPSRPDWLEAVDMDLSYDYENFLLYDNKEKTFNEYDVDDLW